MAKSLLLIFLGGGLGSVTRFGAVRLALWAGMPALPVATFGINALGSLLIGLLWALPAVAGREPWAQLLIVGFCGGFTTFSAFSWENLTLLRNGQAGTFVLYALGSVAVCLLAVWAGHALGKALQ